MPLGIYDHLKTKTPIYTEERNKKISTTQAGRKLSQETKRKMSEVWEKRKQIPGYKHPSRGKKRKPFSEERKRKMSIAQIGKTLSLEHRKKLSLAHTGVKLSKTHIDRIVLGRVGKHYKKWKGEKPRCLDCGKILSSYNSKYCKKCFRIGERSYNFKGYKSNGNIVRISYKNTEWRKQVFKRDDYTCQKCKEKGGTIEAHHIKNFSQFVDYRFIIDNGITLCKKCHRQFHNIFGRQNNNKEQINLFTINDANQIR